MKIPPQENQQTICDCSDIHYLTSGEVVTFLDPNQSCEAKENLHCEITVLSEDSFQVGNPENLKLDGMAVKVAFSPEQRHWKYV